MPFRDPGELDAAIKAFAFGPHSGLLVIPDAATAGHRGVIIAAPQKYRLPAIYLFRYFVDDGGLISYGVDTVETLSGLFDDHAVL